MQFALFSHVSWPEGIDPHRIIGDTTEQVQYGEELGFHGAWFAEHHLAGWVHPHSLIPRCAPLEGEKRVAYEDCPTRLTERTVDGQQGNSVLLPWLGFRGHEHALRHVKTLHGT